ncbi:MAG: TetR family transcriptional regulator, partial [Aeromicrobium sp.]|nr:TetR family transcriptional regulator [Aeromicrobium sp.]
MSRLPQGRGARVPTTRSDATRERILSSAAKTLSAKGYSESRLVDIADTAQLRPPAVYYYFDSRDDLIAEVMRVGQERVREHVEEALAQIPLDGSAMDKICAAVEAHLRVQLELSDFANAVTRNAGHVPPAVREALQHESDAYHDVWRELLLEAATAGDLRSDL